MSETDPKGFLNAFYGAITIIAIMICMVTCLYKYAVCQEKNVNIRPMIPITSPYNMTRVYTTVTTI